MTATETKTVVTTHEHAMYPTRTETFPPIAIYFIRDFGLRPQKVEYMPFVSARLSLC